MADQKKLRERADLDLLADKGGLPWIKDADDSEQPDFLVRQSGGTLGIEVAEIAIDHSAAGSQLRQVESVFSAFRTAAEDELKKRVAGAEVGIFVSRRDDGTIPRGKDILAAAKQLADILEPIVKKPIAPGASVWNWEDGQTTPLATFTDIVRLFPTPGTHQPLWSAPLVGWGQDNVQPGMAELILQKEHKRATAYVQNCATAWLLLVATGTSAASMVDLAYFDPSDVPPNGFERIYILDRLAPATKLIWNNGSAVP